MEAHGWEGGLAPLWLFLQTEMNVAQTLAELVAIDSVSSRSNSEIVNYLSERCEALGLHVKRFPYTDEGGIEKINLIALAGAEFSEKPPEVELALVGHTDTVPYDPAWKDALHLVEDDGKLYGRGACDTKAFIAVTLEAFGTFESKKLRRPLALVFTADEETGLIGAKRLAQARVVRCLNAIVGEPTSLQPMRAGKGYCLAELTVKGREAHSAYPNLGTSAIFRAAGLLARIEDFAVELQKDEHAAFDPPYTTLNVGLIKGGTAKNVIPAECRFTLEWRPIPGQGPEGLLDLLFAAIEQEKMQDPQFVCDVDAARADDGFETSPNSKLVMMLEELSGKRAGTVAFGTEAAQMTEMGAEAVVLGPGDIREAHRTGEFVPIAELKACVTILRQAIERLCS